MRHVSKKYSSFQLQPRLASKADRGLSLAFRLIHVHILATEEYALEQVDVVLKCSLSAVQLIAMGLEGIGLLSQGKDQHKPEILRARGKPTSFS